MSHNGKLAVKVKAFVVVLKLLALMLLALPLVPASAQNAPLVYPLQSRSAQSDGGKAPVAADRGSACRS
jgi:hypothetical protein